MHTLFSSLIGWSLLGAALLLVIALHVGIFVLLDEKRYGCLKNQRDLEPGLRDGLASDEDEEVLGARGAKAFAPLAKAFRLEYALRKEHAFDARVGGKAYCPPMSAGGHRTFLVFVDTPYGEKALSVSQEVHATLRPGDTIRAAYRHSRFRKRTVAIRIAARPTASAK